MTGNNGTGSIGKENKYPAAGAGRKSLERKKRKFRHGAMTDG